MKDKKRHNKKTNKKTNNSFKNESLNNALNIDEEIKDDEAKNALDEILSKEGTSEAIEDTSDKDANITKEEASSSSIEEGKDEESTIKENTSEIEEDIINKKNNADITSQEINEKKIKKNKRFRILNTIITILVTIELIIGTIGLGYTFKLLDNKPKFDKNVLASQDSTVIYDSEGNPVIELGLYLRENIEYDELPTSLIDAFVAVEDSRYFHHFGFDIPRFMQAALINIRTKNFSQGGSTITMQLIKNSYFQIDAGSDSTLADRDGVSGIKRKAQEIALAIEANASMSKKEIFALFLNKINFGNNIRGVQKAAQYYFGKDSKDLTLPESAFLAGIINSPNSYNPYNDLYKNSGNIYLNPKFNYLENATSRRNETLSLMLLHGYITQEEYDLAKSVKMENLLSGVSSTFGETRSYYQSYIDAVIEEVHETTGKDPYTTSMKIYTNMDSHMQKYVTDIQNSETEIKFRHADAQSAIVVLNNQTGELIALSGGRNQTEARMFNRAVDSKIQPGSTIKPIFEYALAFEKLGWATSYTITDQPIYLYNGKNLIRNAGGQSYYGDMLITEAIARSLNTPAVQTLMKVVEETSEEECIDYLKAIGFDVDYEDFDLQFAIGGNRLTVSPVQLAAAHAILMNKGNYIAPHTINHIEFADGTKYEAPTTGKSVLSEGAAYLTAYCEEYNVSGPFFNYMQILKSKYPVYAKTGTTDWGSSGTSVGIPKGAAKDSWLVCQTSNYTITIWMGFDKMAKGTYFTVADDNANIKGRIGKKLLDELNNHFDYNPHYIERPEDVVEIKHIRGVYPYAYPTSGTPVTGLIKKEFYSLTNIADIPKETKVGVFCGMEANFNDDGTIGLSWLGFGKAGEGMKDISASNIFGDTTYAVGRSYYDMTNYIYPSTFYADVFVNGSHVTSVSTDTPYYTVSVDASSGDTVTVCGYTSDNSQQNCSDFKK